MTPFKKKMLMLQLILFTTGAVFLVAGLAYKGRDGNRGAEPFLPAPDISSALDITALDPDIARPAMAEDAALECRFAPWTGQPVDEDALTATGRPYRILPPGSIWTMNYRPDRINVHVDNDGVVLFVDCG